MRQLSVPWQQSVIKARILLIDRDPVLQLSTACEMCEDDFGVVEDENDKHEELPSVAASFFRCLSPRYLLLFKQHSYHGLTVSSQWPACSTEQQWSCSDYIKKYRCGEIFE